MASDGKKDSPGLMASNGKKNGPSLITFAARADMAEKVADLVQAALEVGLGQRGRAVFGVSGGSTPKSLHEALSARDLDWPQVTALLVDERWVPKTHPRSNEAFVEATLKQSKASGVAIVGLYRDTDTPEAAVNDVAADVETAAPVIDVLVLGLGGDGHTASWFPHADGLEAAMTAPSIAAITAQKSDITGEEVARMTLTLPKIAAARRIILLIAGDDKRATFETALHPGPTRDMPIRAILQARPDIWVCWAA